MKVWKLVIVVLAVGMLSVSAVAGPPESDCSGAVPVPTPVDPCVDNTPTGPPGSCAGGGGVLDVWQTFVATATTARVRTDLSSAGTDSDYGIYSGTCGNLTEIGCSEDDATAPGSPWLGDVSVKGLAVGDTYYIQMGTFGDYCPGGSYTVDVIMPDDSGRVCGDGVVNVYNEVCDGSDNFACGGGDCDADCLCLLPSPALPIWGVIGLGVLLVGGGATAVARRRKKA